MKRLGLQARTLLAACAVLAAAVAAARGAAPKVDVDDLATRGASSAQQWRQSNSRWSVATTLPNAVVATIDVVHAPSRQRMILRVERGDQRQELLRVISRDGYWFVTDAKGQSKWRPYELPTDSVLFYALLSRATPKFVDRESVESLGRLRRVDGSVATFMSPLDDSTAGTLRTNLANLEQYIVRNPQDPNAPGLREQAAQVRSLLAEGSPTQVDLTSGQIIDQGAERFHTHSTLVASLPFVEERLFDVDDVKWTDQSDDPAAPGKDLNKLLMIGSFPGYQPTMREYELDGRLADLSAGRIRRIPYRGPVCSPGCFTRDRKQVIVGGTVPNGSVQPFLIDLSSGSNRALGGPLLEVGSATGATLSPDGQRVAVAHRLPWGKTTEIRIYVIDLSSGDGIGIGDPVDAGFVQWMPDGNQLLVVSKRGETLTLCTMDLEGHVTPLRKGTAPLVLPERKQILYQDPDDGLWYLCDLEGKNAALFGNGYKGYGWPAVSPDGQQLLMLQENPPQPNRPVIFPFGQANGQPLSNEPGMWGFPAWR